MVLVSFLAFFNVFTALESPHMREASGNFGTMAASLSIYLDVLRFMLMLHNLFQSFTYLLANTFLGYLWYSILPQSVLGGQIFFSGDKLSVENFRQIDLNLLLV